MTNTNATKPLSIATNRDGSSIYLTLDVAGETEVLAFTPEDVPQLVMMLCAAMGQSATSQGADQRERFLLPAQDVEVGVLQSGQVGMTILPSPASRMSFLLERGLALRLAERLEQSLGTASPISPQRRQK